MKILFVTSFLGKNYGGAEISTSLLKDSLIDQGIKVNALTTRKNKNMPSDTFRISFPVEIPKKMLIVGNSYIDHLLSKKISNQIKEIRPDIIHVQDTYILPAAVLANKHDLPIVATIRNSVLSQTWRLMFSKPMANVLIRRNNTIIQALNKIDLIIAVSDYIQNELIGIGVRSRVERVYNLHPLMRYPEHTHFINEKKNSNINLFALGFLADFKGFRILTKAIKIVVDKKANVSLTIAGDGPKRKELVKLATKLQISNNINFIGSIPYNDLSLFYNRSDIVICPSIYPEPFGRTALEGMYFGKPVIASNVGGLPEIVLDGYTGLLVPPNDPDMLADAILKLIDNPHMRLLMEQNCQKVIEQKFNHRAIVSQHLQIYNDLLKK